MLTSRPKYSIISVTYRSVLETKRFVESVLRHTKGDYEFILGVNGTQDEVLSDYLHQLEKREHRVRLVWSPLNTGVRMFNTVMRMAQSDFIFRCDSDIEIMQDDWNGLMVKQLGISQKDVGPVVAVGTLNSIWSGYHIVRAQRTLEVGMIMSNCMMIHRPTANIITDKLQTILPELRQRLEKARTRRAAYTDELSDMEATVEYARWHAPWWDLNFGGKNEPKGYGADDMWWSLLARWCGLKLIAAPVDVRHYDSSMRPGYGQTRHILVSRGFQYLRTSLSLIMDEYRPEIWENLPLNLPVLSEFIKSCSNEKLSTTPEAKC